MPFLKSSQSLILSIRHCEADCEIGVMDKINGQNLDRICTCKLKMLTFAALAKRRGALLGSNPLRNSRQEMYR